MNDDRASARLLFSEELRAGTVAEADLDHPAVRSAVRVRPVPPRPVRLAHKLAYVDSTLEYRKDVVRPFERARRAVLGEAAAGPPRFLLRVDELPEVRAFDDPRFDPEVFRRFHAVLADAGVPYLVAVSPRVSRRPYDPTDDVDRPLRDDERELLADLARDGVTFATHGRNHRTRYASPKRHSELLGLKPAALGELLTRSEAELADAGVRPRVFVPPFNRFAPEQYPELARRFDVVCGGPESVGLMGWQRTPQVRDGAVYLPCYGRQYDRAAQLVDEVRRLAERRCALWVPLTIHWGWELDDDLEGLRRLAAVLADGLAGSWARFLEAVDEARDHPAPADARAE